MNNLFIFLIKIEKGRTVFCETNNVHGRLTHLHGLKKTQQLTDKIRTRYCYTIDFIVDAVVIDNVNTVYKLQFLLVSSLLLLLLLFIIDIINDDLVAFIL